MNEAMCAHLKVEYRPEEHANGTRSERWRCLSCGGDFWPQHWLFPAPWLREAAPSLHKEGLPQLDNWVAEFSLTDESGVLDEFTLDEQAKIWGLIRTAWNTARERTGAAPHKEAAGDEFVHALAVRDSEIAHLYDLQNAIRAKLGEEEFQLLIAGLEDVAAGYVKPLEQIRAELAAGAERAQGGYECFTDPSHPCPTCGSYTASESGTERASPAGRAEEQEKK